MRSRRQEQRLSTSLSSKETEMIIHCTITCRDFDRILDMVGPLSKIYISNPGYSLDERSLDLTCQEEDLDAIRKVVARFDRHARIEIWRPKGEPPPIILAEQPPEEDGEIVVDLAGPDALPRKFLGHPFIKSLGKRPEA